jgi:hypothetical protein
MPGRLTFARHRADSDRQRRCGKPDLPHGSVVSLLFSLRKLPEKLLECLGGYSTHRTFECKGAANRKQNDEWQLQGCHMPLAPLRALVGNQPTRLTVVVNCA